MALTVNVIGATGLVGRELVGQLLENPGIEKVRIFVRRDFGSTHPKLEQRMTDFDQPGSWKTQLNGDVLFSTLGTTLKQAGSKEKQWLIDFTYQLDFAREASGNGIPVFILVSSAGANAGSRIFYSRMKGELDNEVLKLPFRKTVILRPSILAGRREKPRFVEEWSVRVMTVVSRLIFRKYRPVPAATVAKSMINAALAPELPSKHVVQPGEIFKLAGS